MPKASFTVEDSPSVFDWRQESTFLYLDPHRVADDPVTDVRSGRESEESIKEFAARLLIEGTTQPIVVRPLDDDYRIIIGRRRLLAAKINDTKVPARIIDVDDATARRLAFEENYRRKQFSPIDLAKLFLEARAAVNGDKNWSEKVSKQFGVSRATVTETIKMYEGLAGDQELIDQVHSGALAADAAILLAKTRGEERQQQLQTAQALAEAEEARKPARKPRKGASEPAEPKELDSKESKQAKVRAKHVRAAAQAAGQPILGIMKRDELLAGLQHLIVPEAPAAMNGFLEYATSVWASGKGTMMELERRWRQIIPEPKTVIIDSLTGAGKVVINRVLDKMSVKKKKTPKPTAKKKSPKSRPPAKKPASKPAKSRKK